MKTCYASNRKFLKMRPIIEKNEVMCVKPFFTQISHVAARVNEEHWKSNSDCRNKVFSKNQRNYKKRRSKKRM